MSERVLAVVVTYNPKPEALGVLLQATLSQVDDVLIVDNASDNFAQINLIVDDLKSDSNRVIDIQPLSENLGLGAGHNIGIKRARKGQFEYVLLLDQDSVPMTDMVSNLVRAHHIKSQNQPVAATGVTYLNADNGSESFFMRFGIFKFQRLYCSARDEDGCIEADFLISSGSLMSLKTLEDVGDMDETLFIDHIDTEWFLRVRSKGYKSYGVCDAVMQHGLGETTHQLSLGSNFFLWRLLGRKKARRRNVPQHKPFRYYYIFRNSILLYKRGYTSNQWKWNDIQRLAMIMVMFALFKAPRRENFSMMVRGIRDGLSGVTGKITGS